MKFSNLLLCICILYTCSTTFGSMYLSQWDLKNIKGKFCGPLLSDALSLVCRGKYNSPTPHKKSMNEDIEEDYEYPFLPKRDAINFLTDEVSKRGVVDECCLKSCTFAELQSYCR